MCVCQQRESESERARIEGVKKKMSTHCSLLDSQQFTNERVQERRRCVCESVIAAVCVDRCVCVKEGKKSESERVTLQRERSNSLSVGYNCAT
jgi:hypothetical protein